MKSKNRTWVLIIILIRVLVTIGIMLTLFLGMWIGYFTVPIILILVFSTTLAISDIGLFVSLKKEKSFSTQELQVKEDTGRYIDNGESGNDDGQ